MGKLKALTKVQVALDDDQNYRLMLHLARMRHIRGKNNKTTKADEIVRLAMIGLQHENKNS